MTRIKPFALIGIVLLILAIVFAATSLPYGKFSAVNGVWAEQYGPPSLVNTGGGGLTPKQTAVGKVVCFLTFSMDTAITFKPCGVPIPNLVIYRMTPAGDLQLVPRATPPGPGGYWTANGDGTVTVFGTGGGVQGTFYYFNFPNPATAPKTIFRF